MVEEQGGEPAGEGRPRGACDALLEVLEEMAEWPESMRQHRAYIEAIALSAHRLGAALRLGGLVPADEYGGPYYAADMETWKECARRWLDANRKSMTWLGNQCDCTAAAVSAALMPAAKRRRTARQPIGHSRVFDQIVRMSGIMRPWFDSQPSEAVVFFMNYCSMLERRYPTHAEAFWADFKLLSGEGKDDAPPSP